MGYLSEIRHSQYRSENTARINRMKGVQSYTPLDYIFPNVPSIFSSLSQRGEKKESEQNPDDSDYITKRTKELLNKVNCKTTDDLNKKLNDKIGEIKTTQSQLSTAQTDLATAEANLNNTNSSIALITQLQKKYPSDSNNPTSNLDQLKEQKNKYIEQIAEFKTKIETLQKELEAHNSEYTTMQTTMQEIVQLNSNSVETKAKDMKAFTTALKKWQNAGEKDNKSDLAKEAIKAFNALGENPSKSAISLYQLYDQDLNRDANQKWEDLYNPKQSKEN